MTYTEYIDKYILGFNQKNQIFPGEHHFVSVFLMSKIHELTDFYPNYVNPDGMKKLPGDLIYDINNVSIEVKFNKIIFTKNEYNK